MLSKLRAQNEEICVLQVDAKVLDLPGVIIADRNAASDWVRFFSVDEGLKALDRIGFSPSTGPIRKTYSRK
jgi:hypothetical protein